MRWTRLVPCLLALALAARPASAQESTGRVSGSVAESETGRPIARATVTLRGTPFGAIADDSGRFIIPAVTPGRYAIRAQLIGYAPADDSLTVEAGRTTTLGLRVRRIAIVLDPVVAVGYGPQRRSDLTGSVSSVTPNAARPTVSLEQMLVGRAPGVQVTQASSAPGGGISIRIRGGSSITGSNEPLYVVDGFPVEN